MDYKVLLNNGQEIELAGAQFNATEFTATLNDQKIVFVNIGGVVVNKHLILAIIPKVSNQ